MLKNYRAWVHFARTRLNRDVHLRDIVLVTGCDLTADWATATFVDRAMDASISFQAGEMIIGNAGLAMWGSWNASVAVPHRCGPLPVVRPDRTPPTSAVSEDANLQPSSPAFNQCIFLRGYRVRERLRLLPTIIKAGAEPTDLGGPPPPDADISDETRDASVEIESLEDATSHQLSDSYDAYDIVARHIFEVSESVPS